MEGGREGGRGRERERKREGEGGRESSTKEDPDSFCIQ